MKLDAYTAGWSEGWTPDPRYKVSVWADKNRKLTTKTSAEPGDWRTDRVPYAREPMDGLSTDDPTEVIVLMWGAQTSKTETGNNFIGYVMHHAPGPMMAVQPTVDMAKRLSKQRLADMIEQTPALRERVAESRSRDSGNTMLSKEFPGGVLILTGANSASGLRSMPARYLFLDEVDAYPLDVDDEGDPVSLAIKRTTTFGRRRKVLITSTPTLKDESRIEKAFNASDRRRYYVACPHCGHEQWLRWRGYSDDDKDLRAKDYRLVWLDEGKTAAGYKCGGDDCGAIIEEFHKTTMLLRGRWIATAPGDGKTRGYHLSSLYSPLGWKSWVEILTEFEACAGDPAQLKVFVNTILAETWEDSSLMRLDAEGLAARAEEYPRATVPAGGLVITAGIDLQRREGGYAQIVFRAWGAGDESWLVDRQIIRGETTDPGFWRQVLEACNQEFPHPSGAHLRAYAVAIDSGDGESTHDVYGFARANKKRHILATKGQSQVGKAALGKPTKQDINIRGTTIKRGADLWPIGSDTIKTTIHRRLRIQEKEGPGVMHWPAGLPDEYYQQLTAEKQMPKVVNGFVRRVWVKKEGAANDDLDCEVMAFAALEYVKNRHNRTTFWQQMAARLGIEAAAPLESEPDAPGVEAVGVPAATAAPTPGRVSLNGWSRQ